jgi:hypothetical protein
MLIKKILREKKDKMPKVATFATWTLPGTQKHPRL